MSVSRNGDPFEKFNLHWNLRLPLILLTEALTHPSYKSVDPDAQDNQRLETLGDSVIDLLVLDWLYHKNVKTEGILTKKRAEVVQNTTLTKIGKALQIGQILRCAPAYTIQEKDIADTVEAIFGALYVANGLDSCQSLLLRLFGDLLDKTLVDNETSSNTPSINENNPKNQLQEFFQQHHLPGPIYQLIKREGTDHDPCYWYVCQGRYQDEILEGKGSGKSKKNAQKKAASDLYKKLLQLENQEIRD
ncbi:MAG: ribonuclease III family protein [Candidatus Thorarchaeota archaeon]